MSNPQRSRPEDGHYAENGEVRAGPGDAGRQDRPEPLPEVPGNRRRGRQATWLLIGLFVAGFVVYAIVFWLPVWIGS